MKHISLTLGLSLLLSAMTLPTFSQVSNDNEDEVNKIDERFAKDFVPGQVLMKMKDSSPAKVRKVQGRFKSAGINTLDAVLEEFGVEDMEQLLPDEKPGRKLRKAKAYNGDVVQEHDLSQLYILQMSEDKLMHTMELVDKLKTLDEVEYAEPNYKVYMQADETICPDLSGNPLTSNQWYLDSYGVKELWNKPIIDSQRPVIAILDTGVDVTHPDLADNIWTNSAEAEGEEGYDNDGNGFKNDIHGWDFINNTGTIRDYNRHGTHVAGIAAAVNNEIGIVGANPMAYIMPITVMQSDGTGDIATIVKGINYAVANGATILNLSLGTYAYSSALRQALEKAYQTAVIVAAAGNDRQSIDPPFANPLFPAAFSFVLGIQAIDQNSHLTLFSNFDLSGSCFSPISTIQDVDGFNYELRAPGVNILSTIPNGNYKAFNGTSMATPLVAGAVSALKMVKEYDSQEILWGDLLHTNNIAEAFAVTERPAELDLLRIQMRDRKELTDETEEDYSSDNEIDAGETVSIYPVIRTTFGEASNIKFHLEMGDEYEDASLVEFLTDEVDFGLHLDAYGRGVSVNPLVLKVVDNIADNRHIKLKIVATCDESEVSFEFPFTIVVNNMIKISGLISEDRTLTADHVYLVNDNIGIMEGATLTIEPGSRLEFLEGMGISSFGKLIANGTPEKPITFVGHNGAKWAGIKTHQSQNPTTITTGDILYTNNDSTLFTLLPSELTPNIFDTNSSLGTWVYDSQGLASADFYLCSYMENNPDFTSRMNLLTDPNYLTPPILQVLSDYNNHCSKYYDHPTDNDNIPNRVSLSLHICNPAVIFENPRDTISYCYLDNCSLIGLKPIMNDCIIIADKLYYRIDDLEGFSNNIINGSYDNYIYLDYLSYELIFSNIVNTYCGTPPLYSKLRSNNYFNNISINSIIGYYLANNSTTPNVDKSDAPSYLGTSREDLVRPYVQEMGNGASGFGTIDLSNMPSRPYSEAHGIVWKVVVNGKDAQDEFEDLAPLGVGRHKFEVYFNRPMNVAVAPKISFGVRDPYTQQAVAEDGNWSADSLVYTAYKTITGKTKSDGLNRIYVYGAEDNEYFEIPYEKNRFNVIVQAAGSLATGFMAEAGLGKVNLTWNNENNDFEDAMGFNVYRYTMVNDSTTSDTIRINQEIVDIETTEYTDYNVTPGTTYYYMYKVLSTDLQEYDVSNVVTATPLTSTLGDANGSGDVDVADVITTVNYAAGQQPKPFIFEAADMNTDSAIDILDVIGIIKKIMNPEAEATAMVEATATYTIENGTLYVESPVALAGVQVQLASLTPNPSPNGEGSITVADDLNGFEHLSAWLSDNDYLFMAYNMNGKTLTPGKHALLHIGNGKISDIRLSDANGRNIVAVGDEATRVNRMASDVMTVKGIYDLQGRKLTGDSSKEVQLPKGVYIVNGQKVVR